MSQLFLGIDVSTKENVVCFIDANGKSVEKTIHLPNNQPGTEELEQRINQLMQKKRFREIKIGTEATSFYDFHLVNYLAESSLLAQYHPKIYRFNPKHVHNFKKGFSDKDKTDLVDAQIIAEKLRFGRDLPHPYVPSEMYLPLQRLTRYRFHLIDSIVREKNFFLAYLFLKFSSYKKVKSLKGQILGATSQAVITEFFSPDEIVNLPLEDLASFVAKEGKNRSPRPKQIAKEIRAMARESYRIRPGLTKSLNIVLASTLQNIRAFRKSLKEINLAIENELRAFPNTLCSVNGLGPIFSAGILAEIGDVSRFSSQAQLAKFAGLWWPRKQSADFEAEERRLRKSGNKYLRYYLVEAANSLRVHNERYRRFYQKKYREVRRYQHKRALVLTARKAVRLIFSLLKNQQLYDPNRI